MSINNILLIKQNLMHNDSLYNRNEIIIFWHTNKTDVKQTEIMFGR